MVKRVLACARSILKKSVPNSLHDNYAQVESLGIFRFRPAFY